MGCYKLSFEGNFEQQNKPPVISHISNAPKKRNVLLIRTLRFHTNHVTRRASKNLLFPSQLNSALFRCTWTNTITNRRRRYTNTSKRVKFTFPLKNQVVTRTSRSHQLNNVIFLSMGFLHMGQTSSEDAHSTHVPCPHRKATLRGFSKHMAHMLASSISLTCARRDRSEWSVSRYFSSFAVNSEGWVDVASKKTKQGRCFFSIYFRNQAGLIPTHFRSFLVKLSTEKSSEVFGNLGNVRVRFVTFGERSESSSRLLKGS